MTKCWSGVSVYLHDTISIRVPVASDGKHGASAARRHDSSPFGVRKKATFTRPS